MRQQAAESFPGIEIMWESRQEFYPMFRGNVRGGGMALRQIRLSLEDDFKQGISPEESFAKSIPRANASLETLTRRPTTLQMLYE